MQEFRRVRTLVFLVALLAAGSACAEFDFRAMFIDRFDYTYNSGNIPAMTSAINAQMQSIADQGLNHVVFQVRGRADAFYNSNFEPKATGLTPGFDPLQTAIDAAHARGLKLHAWINATPMWNTTAVNPPVGHIYHNTNPSFRLMDINGNLEPQQGWSNYSSANPILPEVHTHINNVVNDIATNYAVDGIHLDYIRYLPGANNAAADFAQLPHDPISHQMFQQATGLDAGNIANFTAYKTYITGRITDLVASIKQTVDTAEVSTGRAMDLSASVWRDPDVGKNDYMQDYRTWLEQDLLDVAMPMIYLSALNNHIYFDANLANTLNISTNAKIAPNLASYLHVDDDVSTEPGLQDGGGVALTLSQMQRAYDGFGNGGTDGVGYYDYPAFFNGYSAADRQAIKDFFDNIDSQQPPPPPGPGSVLDDFEVDEGHFNWNYNLSPVSQTFGLAGGPGNASSPSDRVTSDAQRGIGSQLLNLVVDAVGDASWQLRHNSGIGSAAMPAGNVALDATGFVGFWLKTDEAGITVRLAIDDPVSGNTALEQGIALNVLADNEWHLYQWDFEDDAQWDAFAGGANGIIDAVGGVVSIDSIWFAGVGNAQIYLDTVSHNPEAMLAAATDFPGDYNDDGLLDAADYNAWRATFGQDVSPGTGADGNGDGMVDTADYIMWRKLMSQGGGSSLGDNAAVPEPATAGLAVTLLLTVAAATRRPGSRI